ncbi:hypothetical protein [Streptomyces atratus]|uniref:hypothetical protein n=1 Tax=Streptomyces atratus TaxID=1893 RepID=UPI00365FDC3E
MEIIKDPIGFMDNLVRAVGAGLNLFITNVAEHLKTGVVSWLLGTAVKGLELPQKFDPKGIIQLIASLRVLRHSRTMDFAGGAGSASSRLRREVLALQSRQTIGFSLVAGLASTSATGLIQEFPDTEAAGQGY